MVFTPSIVVVIIFAFIILTSAVKFCREYERVIVFRLGRLILPPKGPGVFLIIPVVDRMLKISLRTETYDMSSHEFSTMDRGAVRLDASVSFRVIDPARAVREVEDYLDAMKELAKRSFADALRGSRVSQIVTSRNSLINRVRTELKQGSKPWGIEIVNVQIKGLKSSI
ncbi:MAG: hypothetical protein GTO13_19390 [Proteobacteria bacterium]|nr:hypothetical protein [Pseudomonadota bacterium]